MEGALDCRYRQVTLRWNRERLEVQTLTEDGEQRKETLASGSKAEIEGVRLFFVEEFLPYSWAFLPADASLQCSFRGDSNQASAYPRLSGGQPSLETVPNTVGLSPSGALPSGHSRGVLVRFHWAGGQTCDGSDDRIPGT